MMPSAAPFTPVVTASLTENTFRMPCELTKSFTASSSSSSSFRVWKILSWDVKVLTLIIAIAPFLPDLVGGCPVPAPVHRLANTLAFERRCIRSSLVALLHHTQRYASVARLAGAAHRRSRCVKLFTRRYTSYLPQNQKVTWIRAKFPFFVKT